MEHAFTRSPYLHEMCYVLEKIRQTGDKEKSLETMMRYGKLLEFGADDLTALRKFCNWSQESLVELCQVLKLYETCKSLDAKDFVGRKASDVMKGKPIQMPHKLFRKFACMEEEYFSQIWPE